MKPMRILLLLLATFASLAAQTTTRQGDDTGNVAVTAELNQALAVAREAASPARQRLAVRRVIRDAEQLVETKKDSPDRFPILEFLFRARKQLVAIDDAPEHRNALLETCRELVKAPDDMATLRIDADLLLSQSELARQGADNAARANSLLTFAERYIDTSEGARVLRMAVIMALELGESRVTNTLQQMIEKNFASDLGIIEFQRDRLGGQVFGAAFAGAFERADGKIIRYPMDGFGRLTACVFWSNDEEGRNFLKGLAECMAKMHESSSLRIGIASFNLDDLPDAGESVVRSLGVDWHVLRLPGGRENPVYKAYARKDPHMLLASPSGCAAMIMTGTGRERVTSTGDVDFSRILGSSLTNEWGNARYIAQLSSLTTGDFLVLDPEGGINPALPPELKATVADGSAKPMALASASVPEDTLRAIQQSFVPIPQRFRITHAEALASYRKTAGLCRRAIASHPTAGNLWIVRNRLIIALMGQWKSHADINALDAAVAEARAALDAGYPEGCDVVARFCLARGALLEPAADPQMILSAFIADCGGDHAPGSALAAASLLALDIADRRSFDRFRSQILAKHTENPIIWAFTAFLLDRHHRYWLFQVPFAAGWSYKRRMNYFMSVGNPEDAHRILRAELLTLDGKPQRMPQQLDSAFTILVFAPPPPWSSNGQDGLPPSPLPVIAGINTYIASRPAGDVKLMLATLGGEPAAVRASIEATGDPARNQPGIPCPVVIVPGGTANPMVHKLGILSEDEKTNSVLLRNDGSIAVALSGFMHTHNNRNAHRYAGLHANVIQRLDEEFVTNALQRGDRDAARTFIFTHAPLHDPNAVDERGRKRPTPVHSLPHLRARARVYAAFEEWDKALADAEEVVLRQLQIDGSMSMRTDDLDESEALRDEILSLSNPRNRAATPSP